MQIMKHIAIAIVGLIALLAASPSFASSDSIIFVRDGDLWKIDLASNKETPFLKDAHSTALSRDGKSLAFVRKGNVWVANSMGKNTKQVTNYPLNKKEICSLEWFPKGDRLAFAIDEDYTVSYSGPLRKVYWPPDWNEPKENNISLRSIWLIMKDGKEQTKWIGNTYGSGAMGVLLGDVDNPKWSPTCDTMVFSRNGDIWVAEVEEDKSTLPGIAFLDKNETRLAAVADYDNHYGVSSENYYAGHFSWTPDGDQIIYDLYRHGGSGFDEIWQMNSDGTKNKRLLSLDVESFPQLSADGKKIAYIDHGGLWVTDKDVISPKKIANNVDYDNIVWCSEPKQ
jgi:Tol biopolymer transport system component